jgi:hypothetical protein
MAGKPRLSTILLVAAAFAAGSQAPPVAAVPAFSADLLLTSSLYLLHRNLRI